MSKKGEITNIKGHLEWRPAHPRGLENPEIPDTYCFNEILFFKQDTRGKRGSENPNFMDGPPNPPVSADYGSSLLVSVVPGTCDPSPRWPSQTSFSSVSFASPVTLYSHWVVVEGLVVVEEQTLCHAPLNSASISMSVLASCSSRWWGRKMNKTTYKCSKIMEQRKWISCLQLI